MEFSEFIPKPKLDGVLLIAPFQKTIEVTLCITSHHMILSARTKGIEELLILHDNIDMVDKKPSILGGTLTLKCKDLRIIQLQINTSEQDFISVSTSLERLASLDEPLLKYPFFYRPMYKILEDGWLDLRPENEFSKLVKRDEWRISHVNANYSVCPTYPKVVIVPKNIDDETIILASRFREGGRFPVLSYRHEGGASLIRSSQPLTGPNNRRCREDEALVNAAITTIKRGYIVDTRSLNLAQAAKTRGGGFEVEMHYPQWKRIHSPIERRQTWLDSFSKLMEVCNDTTISCDKWLSKLDSSCWFTNVKDLMNCACLVAQFLDKEGASVLVHGAEGTDATLLITSLAQIILNPDCRTVRGFEALIEREWIQGGYPFSKRHANSCYSAVSSRSKCGAPTFLLFLDCVYQVHSQFPCSFEFSTTFLIWLFEHSYSSQFGSFLGNNEKEREELQLPSRTTCLWSYINQLDTLQAILNPLYEPNKNVIWPSVAPVSLNVWNEMYLRWIIDQSEKKQAWEKIAQLKENEKKLRCTAVKLRRQLIDYQKELQQKAFFPGPSYKVDCFSKDQESLPEVFNTSLNICEDSLK